MQFWQPYALSFLVTTACILSIMSTLDCNFVSLYLPFQVENALSISDIPLDDGMGVGFFTYEVLSVRRTSTEEINVGQQVQQGIARNRCLAYGSANFLDTGLVDKRKFYLTFSNEDSAFTTVRLCAVMSIFGTFVASIISLISLMKGRNTEIDYGPRMAYGEVKKSTLRTIAFLVLLCFCLVTEGIKFRFLNIHLCQRYTVDVVVNSTSNGLETFSQGGKCTVARGMTMSMIAFSCLSIVTILSLVS